MKGYLQCFDNVSIVTRPVALDKSALKAAQVGGRIRVRVEGTVAKSL